LNTKNELVKKYTKSKITSISFINYKIS
jgi:hypothetical protein